MALVHQHLTIPQVSRCTENDLTAGLLEAMSVTSRFFDVLPFQEFPSADFPERYLGETTIAHGDNAALYMSRAKNIGRKFIGSLAEEFLPHQSRHNRIDAKKTKLGFDLLDLLFKKFKGPIDFCMLEQTTYRALLVLRRSVGGENIEEVITLPSGSTVPSYRGVPFFRNDYSQKGVIFAGQIDDGTRERGISGIVPDYKKCMKVKNTNDSELMRFNGDMISFRSGSVAALTDIYVG